MARYNHFSLKKYVQISFSDLNVGDKFRNDFHDKNTKRRRRDVVCVKTGYLTYEELRSREPRSFFKEDANVSSYSELIKSITESK